MQTIQIGLIGLGNVGAGVVQILQQQASLIAERLGARLELKRVATRHPDRDRVVSSRSSSRVMLEVPHDPEITIGRTG
jgi:homoserine dehydrogenase